MAVDPHLHPTNYAPDQTLAGRVLRRDVPADVLIHDMFATCDEQS